MATVVVTGSNKGIGLEMCRQFVARGDNVIGVCRSPSDELRQLGARVEEGVDVSSSDDVAALAQRLADTNIDILVNNAGVMSGESLGDLDIDRIRRQFDVNALGPLRITAALAPRIPAGGKVAIVTSRMGSIADNTSGGMYGYRLSKAAANMAGATLANDLKRKGIAVVLLHPGFIRTEMTKGNGNSDPPEAAAGLIARIDELSVETTGRFMHANGEQLPW